MTGIDLGLEFFSRKRTPVIVQSEAAECGLACIAMVAGYHGHRTHLRRLRERWPLSLKGLSMAQMMDITSQLGFAARAVKLDLAGLARLQLPCIIHWNLDHFVVLEKVNRSGTIVIIDPAVGRRTLNLQQASEAFTGVALELLPNKDFQVCNTQPKLRLSNLFRENHRLLSSLSQIVLLSLALQVFALVTPFYTQILIDDVTLSGDRALLHLLALCFAGLALVNGLVAMARSWVVVYIGTLLKYSWSASLFGHLIRLPLDYFEKRHVGDIQSRFGSIGAVQELISTKVVEALVDGLMTVTTVTVMFMYDARLGAIVLASLILYLGVRLMLFSRLRNTSYEAVLAGAERDSCLLESVRGIMAIKNFGRELQRESTLQNKLADEINANVQVSKLGIWQGTANQMIFALQNVLVLWIGAGAILDSTISAGMLMAFMAYKTQFIQRASALIDHMFEFRLMSIHLERLEDIVATEPEPGLSHNSLISTHDMAISGEIEVRDVWFRYACNEPYVLQGVNLRIRAGEHVVIAAPSGVGKTTLLKVMMGLLAPTRGQVLIDGQPLDTVGLQAYRRQTAAVMQEDQLLAGSILDNITFFDTDIDMKKVNASARAASIDADIMAMPMRYSTLIGDMGAALSGGQKQRLLLARALYKTPRILFLDEASSHLDQTNADRINEALDGLPITRIAVAHRKETIASAERVIYLTDQSSDTLEKASHE